MHWESQLKWSDNKDKYNFYGTSLLIFVFFKNSDLLTIHPQPVKFLKNEDGVLLLLSVLLYSLWIYVFHLSNEDNYANVTELFLKMRENLCKVSGTQ